jgi:hypothetical protein
VDQKKIKTKMNQKKIKTKMTLYTVKISSAIVKFMVHQKELIYQLVLMKSIK